jgi:hypothetical protein
MPRINSKPLHIGVMGMSLGDPTLMQFQNKGHLLTDVTASNYPSTEYDAIIGPRCWRIDPLLRLGDDRTNEKSLERQLDMMEKGVRAIKYPKKKDEQDAK